MEAADVTDGGDEAVAAAEIDAAESSPGRTVFSERDNPDGWIATDLTVDARE